MLSNCRTTSQMLRRLIGLQTDQLQAIEQQLESNDIKIRFWEQKYNSSPKEETVHLEQKIKRNDCGDRGGGIWGNAPHIEEENEKQLQDQLEEIWHKVTDGNSTMESGLEAEKTISGSLRGTSQLGRGERKGGKVQGANEPPRAAESEK